MKKIISLLLAVFFSLPLSLCVLAEEEEPASVQPPELPYTASAYLYNIENEQAIYTYNPDEKVFPTSTVKLMTGILALEHLGERLDEKVTVTAEMLSEVRGNNIKLAAGEQVKIRDLIGATLVNGANDTAYALAYTVAGSSKEFVQMMNAKAADIGAHNTVYTNPTGMHDENMTTTVKDTCTIALYAYNKVPGFMDFAAALKWTLEASNRREAFTVYNRNCLLSLYYEDSYYYNKARGMNAGSTYEGGYCVVTTAATEADGNALTYMAVVMNASADEEGTIYSYVNAKALLEYAFKAYMYVDVLSPEQVICEMPVTLANGVDHVTLVSADSLKIYLPSDTDVEKDIKLEWATNTSELQAPVKKGEAVGSVFAMYKGELIGKAELCTTADISRSDLLYAFHKISQFTSSRFFIATLISAAVLAVAYVFGSAYLRQKRKYSRYK